MRNEVLGYVAGELGTELCTDTAVRRMIMEHHAVDAREVIRKVTSNGKKAKGNEWFSPTSSKPRQGILEMLLCECKLGRIRRARKSLFPYDFGQGARSAVKGANRNGAPALPWADEHPRLNR